MTRGLAVVAAVVGVLTVGGCGSAAGGSQLTAAPGSPTIGARNLAFTTTSLRIAAGAPFTLDFDNEDSAPHNVAVYRDDSARDRLFAGEVFSGPQTRVYAVPALPEGTWFFRCDVHPAMHGELVAGVIASS